MIYQGSLRLDLRTDRSHGPSGPWSLAGFE
jgi:hypothetical protein